MGGAILVEEISKPKEENIIYINFYDGCPYCGSMSKLFNSEIASYCEICKRPLPLMVCASCGKSYGLKCPNYHTNILRG